MKWWWIIGLLLLLKIEGWNLVLLLLRVHIWKNVCEIVIEAFYSVHSIEWSEWLWNQLVESERNWKGNNCKQNKTLKFGINFVDFFFSSFACFCNLVFNLIFFCCCQLWCVFYGLLFGGCYYLHP
jgi:hypothetical protein